MNKNDNQSDNHNETQFSYSPKEALRRLNNLKSKSEYFSGIEISSYVLDMLSRENKSGPGKQAGL